jgi:DNA-binding NarL/FixJ family response regulator
MPQLVVLTVHGGFRTKYSPFEKHFMPAKTASNKQQVPSAKASSSRTDAAKLRILVADDHSIVGQAVAGLLAPEFDVVGHVSDSRALLESAQQLKPNVVILDLTMPSLNGMDTGRQIKDLLPDTKIVVLTANQDSDLAAAVLRTWGSGFVLKQSAASELVKAVREVFAGKTYVAAGVITDGNDSQTPGGWLKHTKSLTMRQREVLQLLAEGCTMKEAAKVLGLTARTVAFHKYKIMQQFGIKNNSDLLRLAIKEHVIPPP